MISAARLLRGIAGVSLLSALALPTHAANESRPGASSPSSTPNTTAAQAKAAKCAELKKRIADFQAAQASAPKGAKLPGGETIKSDIAWYQANCK